MSTFSTYNTLIEQKIANTSEVFYDAEMKRQATNDLTKQILQQYDIPEMIIRATQTFASGIGTPPADYFRMVKLWDDDDNLEYVYRVPDEFDSLDDTASNWWTEDYNVAAADRRLLLKPTSVTSLDIRYIQIPTQMDDDSTDNGLSTQWDEVISYGVAMKLLQISNRYEEAQEYERLYKSRLSDVYGALKNPGGIKANNRFKSKYERLSQLGVNSVTSINL